MLSPNLLDVECRIQGNLRPENGKIPCCGDYAKCSVWRSHKKMLGEIRTAAIGRELTDNRSRHVLSSTPDREKVRA